MRESPSDAVTDNRLYVQSFAKGVEVILAFGAGRSEMNLPEIAAVTGMSKSAAQRFTFTLEALGYLAKHPETKRYRLTPKVIELGYRYLLTDPVVERASPYLLELNRKCGENINIAQPDGTDMVYVGRFPSFFHMPVYMPIGRRLPMYCTAAGRAYLAALDPRAAAEILDRSRLERYTPTTVTDRQALLDLIARAREEGFSTADGEYYQGDLGIGIALTDRRGQPVGSVNLAAPSSRWTLARMKRELAPQLMETCRLICTTPPEPRKAEPFELGVREMRSTS